jgi:8-oxo-dGTP pyrophosphatase MutT (NUDIX family)
MTSASDIALWADKLRDIAALGLHFSESVYDRECYRAIQDISIAMSAAAVGESIERIEPLRATMFSRPTPLAAGDGAVIDDRGRLLLVQRADNHKWAMPGGALEVGETPAEGVIREVFEETGTRCQPVALVGVFDSRICGTVSPFHLYQFVFLCRPLTETAHETASHAHEVLRAMWFAEDELPADIDPGHVTRIPHAFRVWRDGGPAFFDLPIRSEDDDAG